MQFLSVAKRDADVLPRVICRQTFVINVPCHILPVLLNLDPNVAMTIITIGPNSVHIGRDIDCFVEINIEGVEASTTLKSVIFRVAPEEVLDDLLAVEDVDF